MNDTVRPVPLELVKLRSATNAYVAILRDVDAWAEQVADVNRIVLPETAAMYDRLRDEIRATRNDHENGTVATIARCVAELLGES